MEKLNLNLCKNKKLEQYIINERKKIFGEKELENFFKQYEKTDFYKESNFQGSNLDTYFLLWVFCIELFLFERWCKSLTKNYKRSLYETIEIIREQKINYEKFLEPEIFVETLHGTRRLRNALFHWSGNMDRVFKANINNKNHDEYDAMILKGLSYIFSYKWIKMKI